MGCGDVQLVRGGDEGNGEASDEVARDLEAEGSAVLVGEGHGLQCRQGRRQFYAQICSRT